ncbi:unnamed protein product [Ilex paraguariensis]|uniref:RRM domain-containing protein n=1 Tax=Ilex paraguariensis TaxID=185542 RepID=A0ABC8UFB2_9AQUA
MGDSGIVRFPGILDPRAQEYTPRNPYLPLVQPQIFYPYLPYPPPPSTYPSSSSEFQVMPFCESGGVGYTQFTAPPGYVSADPPLPPLLPPPCVTPSRTLLLSSVPTNVSESTVRRELEVFGDVRAVQMQRVRDGVVTVHFYDLRHAQEAMVEIQEQHMQQQCRLRMHYDTVMALNLVYESNPLVPPLPPPAPGLIAGRAVWAQFAVPVTAGVPNGNNQGTLVIFNLDSEVTASSLRDIFEAFGPVKELRETPLKKFQRFVEFYDIRDAAKALSAMNGKEIHGKSIVLEFSRPGGHSKRFSKVAQNCGRIFPSPPSTPPPPLFLHRKTSCRSLANVPPRCCTSQTQSSGKKPSFRKENPNGYGVNKGNVGGAVQASMSSLCITERIGNGSEETVNDRPPPKKNSKKGLISTSASSKQQSQQGKSSRLWKGSNRAKDFDPRFLINEDAIIESNFRDSRTTVMIKNIPNKYSQKLLLNMLDNHCIHCNEQIGHGDDQPLSSYDFAYLPIDFNNKCNVGYGFVNMTSPQATWRLYKAFHLQSWEVFNSRKICEVTYARLQGLEALKEHFKNSKFPCNTEEYMPVVFSPPRDGGRLTNPVPIFGRHIYSPPLPLSPSAVSSWNDEEINGGDSPEHAVDETGHTTVSHNDDDCDGIDDDDLSGGGSNPNGGENDGGDHDL